RRQRRLVEAGLHHDPNATHEDGEPGHAGLRARTPPLAAPLDRGELDGRRRALLGLATPTSKVGSPPHHRPYVELTLLRELPRARTRALELLHQRPPLTLGLCPRYLCLPRCALTRSRRRFCAL